MNKRLWLKTGRQIIAWGQADFYQILDLINPRDMRDFGLAAADELRLPVASTKISYLGNRWGVDGVILHEFRSNKLAEENQEFDMFKAARGNMSESENPSALQDDIEYMLRATKSTTGGDISVIYARVYDNVPSLRLGDTAGNVEAFFQKSDTLGFAANIIWHKTVVKTEIARKSANLVQSAVPVLYGPSIKKPLTTILIGAEYTPNGDRMYVIEGEIKRVEDFDNSVYGHKNRTSLIMSVSQELHRDTIKLTGLWAHWFEEKSDMMRIGAEFSISDYLKFGLDYINYNADEPSGMLYQFMNNDLVKAQLNFNF